MCFRISPGRVRKVAMLLGCLDDGLWAKILIFWFAWGGVKSLSYK